MTKNYVVRGGCYNFVKSYTSGFEEKRTIGLE